MPQWLMELFFAVIGSTALTGGVGWWFKTRRDDRNREADRLAQLHATLEARVEKLQAKVESLLMDAIARERESNAQLADRIDMDKQQNEVIAAATAALKEATTALARMKGDQ